MSSLFPLLCLPGRLLQSRRCCPWAVFSESRPGSSTPLAVFACLRKQSGPCPYSASGQVSGIGVGGKPFLVHWPSKIPYALLMLREVTIQHLVSWATFHVGARRHTNASVNVSLVSCVCLRFHDQIQGLDTAPGNAELLSRRQTHPGWQLPTHTSSCSRSIPLRQSYDLRCSSSHRITRPPSRNPKATPPIQKCRRSPPKATTVHTYSHSAPVQTLEIIILPRTCVQHSQRPPNIPIDLVLEAFVFI